MATASPSGEPCRLNAQRAACIPPHTLIGVGGAQLGPFVTHQGPTSRVRSAPSRAGERPYPTRQRPDTAPPVRRHLTAHRCLTLTPRSSSGARELHRRCARVQVIKLQSTPYDTPQLGQRPPGRTSQTGTGTWSGDGTTRTGRRKSWRATATGGEGAREEVGSGTVRQGTFWVVQYEEVQRRVRRSTRRARGGRRGETPAPLSDAAAWQPLDPRTAKGSWVALD